MPNKVIIDSLSSRLQFDIKLQVSLRNNAINIMAHYQDKEKFREYIREREEKIRILLNESEDPLIYENGSQIYP